MRMKCFARIAGFLVGVLILPSLVAAQPTNPCAFMPGLNCSPTHVLANAIPIFANVLVAVAAGASVMFVIVGGFLMLISLGEEGSVQKGKMAVVYALVGLVITLLAQSLVAFIGAQFAGLYENPEPLVAFMALAVDAMIFLFNAVFVLMMVFAGFRMGFARGNADEFNKARGMLIWAAVGAIIVNTARALTKTVLNITPLL